MISNRLNFKKFFGTIFLVSSIIFFAIFSVVSLSSSRDSFDSSTSFKEFTERFIEQLYCHIPTVKYGFPIDLYNAYEGKIEPNQFASIILDQHGVSGQTVAMLVDKAKDIYSLTKLRAGKSYLLLKEPTTDKTEFFIYEPNPYNYVVYDLRDTISVSSNLTKI